MFSVSQLLVRLGDGTQPRTQEIISCPAEVPDGEIENASCLYTPRALIPVGVSFFDDIHYPLGATHEYRCVDGLVSGETFRR